ncbi:MAG: CapA family protein [Clostridiales bacterium]|nr:CapA family protein [Clostridiales bacterium]
MTRKQPEKSARRKPASKTPSSLRKNTAAKKTAASRKKAISRKSRYYRQRQLRRRLCLSGLGLAAFLLLLILGLRINLSRESSSETSASAEDSSGESLSINGKENSTDTSSEEEAQEASPASSLPETVTLTVSVVGDCTLGTDENFDYSNSLNAYYENYGSAYFLQNVKSIFETDDLTIANFEGVLTDSTSRADKTYAFKATADYTSILTDGSVEAVNTANNHSHDYGDDSYTDTLEALDAAGIVYFGYEETAVMEVQGIQIGLVGIYELNDHLDCAQQMKENIAAVKEAGADLVIVIFHWGNEKETVPDSNQTTLGRLAIDEGADLVCGHHPHVLQGIETYEGKNIVYSLGNFCFGGNSAPSDMDTMIFQQTFTFVNGELQEDNVTSIIPCSISSASGYNNYQPTPAEGEEADRILQKIQERTALIE